MSESTMEPYSYDYHLVEFIAPGRKPRTRKIDVVASKWLAYDKAKKKFIVRYPPQPYTKETLADFDSRLLRLSDAPKEWHSYSVQLKGRAKTFKEAFEKLEKLKEKETVLTTESEVDEFEAEKNATEQLRIEQFKKKTMLMKDSLNSSKNKDSSLASKESSSKDNTITSSRKPILRDVTNLNTNSASVLEKNIVQSHRNTTNLSNSTITLPNPVTNDNFNADGFGDLNFNSVEMDMSVAEEVVKGANEVDPIVKDLLNPESILTTENKNSLTVLFECCTNTLSEIKEVKRDIQKIKLDIAQILKCGAIGGTFIGTVQQLAEKYKYTIPFYTVTDFDIFDEALKTNHSLREDVCNVLQTGLDPALILSKSFVNMLKMFLSKKVAIQFVAVKVRKDKTKIMKNTSFCNCMETVLKERRQLSNLVTTDKEIVTALSNVLCNARSWFKFAKVDSQETPPENNTLSTVPALPVLNDEPPKKARKLKDCQESPIADLENSPNRSILPFEESYDFIPQNFSDSDQEYDTTNFEQDLLKQLS